MIETIWLVHPEPEMCDAFRHRFDELPGVRVIQGKFEELDSHDCFVTAGNSFGLMTAGIDAACRSMKPPGKWPPLGDITESHPNSWIGMSSSIDTSESATTEVASSFGRLQRNRHWAEAESRILERCENAAADPHAKSKGRCIDIPFSARFRA